MIATAARQKLAAWISPKARADNPIDFGPGYTSKFFGSGLGSNQPDADTLLRESLGVSAMATRAIANRIGSLDPQVKISMRDTAGTLNDEVLDDHILKQLLDRPHPNYSRFQMMWLTANHIVTTGEAYWLKVRNRLRLPMMLQPMPPSKVSPQVEGGVISGYVVQDGKGNSTPLALDDVVRFWFPDPETMYSAEGYLAPNGTVADSQKFSGQHLRSHYQNDATPPIILQAGAEATDPTDAQLERFQAAWIRKYGNRAGSHRGVPAFLPNGWQAIFAAVASGADVTPLLEHWQSNQLMNFGVPASVLGRVISGDRSAAETNQFVMDLHTITPIAVMISDALTLQLAPDFDKQLWVEFDEFVSADKRFELEREAQDLTLKIKTVKQVLEQRGDDPEPATWGELPVGTLADTPYTGEERDFGGGFGGFGGGGGESTSDLEEPDDDEPAPDDLPDAPRTRSSREMAALHWSKPVSAVRILQREKKFTPVFARALRGVFKKQHEATKKNLSAYRARTLPSDSELLFDPRGWGDLFDLATQAIRERAYLEAASESLNLLGILDEFFFSDAVAQDLRLQGADMVKLVNQTTAARIRKELKAALAENKTEGETLKQLEKAIDEIFKGRRKNSATIARTEMHRSSQAGQLEAFRQAQVPFKTWLDARDSNVRETHFQEGILPVPREGLFTLPSGHRCNYPGDSMLPAGESINCRCDAAPVYGIGDEVAGG